MINARGCVKGLGLALVLLGGVPGLGYSANTAPAKTTPAKTTPANTTPWTKVLTQQALARGYDAKLPPNISLVLGLADKGESVPVRQLVGRVEQKVHTYNVSAANHDDLVLFLADEASQSFAAYRLTAGGKLRKAVTYQAGGQPQELMAEKARLGLARERRYWSDYAAGSPPQSTTPGTPKPAPAPKPEDSPKPPSGPTS